MVYVYGGSLMERKHSTNNATLTMRVLYHNRYKVNLLYMDDMSDVDRSDASTCE